MPAVGGPVRHSNASNKTFSLVDFKDTNVPFIVLSNNTQRDNLPSWARSVGMEVKVLDTGSGTKYYTLGADLTTWTEKSQEFLPESANDWANAGAAPLVDGKIPSEYISTVALYDPEEVDTIEDMEGTVAFKGKFFFVADTGGGTSGTFVKKNDNNPATHPDDFWPVDIGVGVTSANGKTGVIVLTFDDVRNASAASQTQFENAVAGSTYASTVNASLFSLNSDLQQVILDIAELQNSAGGAGAIRVGEGSVSSGVLDLSNDISDEIVLSANTEITGFDNPTNGAKLFKFNLNGFTLTVSATTRFKGDVKEYTPGKLMMVVTADDSSGSYEYDVVFIGPDTYLLRGKEDADNTIELLVNGNIKAEIDLSNAE